MTVLLRWVRERAGELARFGVVGVAGIVVNLGVFNLLRLGPLSPEAEIAGDDDRVVTAKIIATLVSILFAWVAHREWTYRGRRRHRPARELVLFGLVNGAALAVEAGTLFASHHWWGFTSLLADNVASLVGIGLGTITRYVGYALFVFDAPAGDDAAVAPAPDTRDDR
ncbi:GtrA family protein [Demequina maris]|uniref:GtrA family protein n=1 Tax=Demequina maris TaxID=1638982 RepID=UPI0007833996|nr:GtrA family protein [Demequina maris]